FTMHRCQPRRAAEPGGTLLKPASVLIIGSGPIVIGQAAEFDYAGTQACKAMREEGVRSILVNSNPATIMTDLGVAEAVVLKKYDVKLLGTPLETIRRAEDRELFRDLLAMLGEPVLESQICVTLDECVAAAEQIGLPVVVRPAYTLGGTGGGLAFSMDQLRTVAAGGLSA